MSDWLCPWARRKPGAEEEDRAPSRWSPPDNDSVITFPSYFLLSLIASYHVRLDGAGGVVQGQAAGVFAEVPGTQGSDPQTEHLALLTVHAVHPAALLDLNTVLGPGHLNSDDEEDERIYLYKLLPWQSGAYVCRRDNLTGNLIPALPHNTRSRMIHSGSLKHKSVYRERRMDSKWEVAALVGERNSGFQCLLWNINVWDF